MVNNCPNTSLPSIIDEKGKTTQQLIDEATNILIRDFSLGLVKFRGKEIKAQYPYTNKHSYEHILKLDEPNIPDETKRRRCVYASKFKTFIEESENKTCQNFKHWKEYDTHRSQWKHILLCEKERLIVILAEFKNIFILITAYYANYPNYVKSQLKQYNSSKYKLK